MNLDLSVPFDQLRRIGEYSAYLECLKIIVDHLPPDSTRPCEYDEGQRMAKYLFKEILAKASRVRDTE